MSRCDVNKCRTEEEIYYTLKSGRKIGLCDKCWLKFTEEVTLTLTGGLKINMKVKK